MTPGERSRRVAPLVAPRPPVIEAHDQLPDAAVIEAMAPLFEGAPGFLGRLAAARPCGTFERLFARAREIALAMPDADQVELLDAHPRLGAPPGSVSALSFVEQGYDREAADAAAEAARDAVAGELARLNAAYEARFGFRYCVFVAGRPRAALLPAFEAALRASPAADRQRALADIVAIAEDRHRTLSGGLP
jgi:2-oxo-4-hydroxy-4-carboxy--5-ureidoimidazoline (OHCU) decarboxylase